MLDTPRFDVVLRGYDRRVVDDLVGLVEAALASSDQSRRQEALQSVSSATVAVALRGYDRRQVDAYLSQARAGLGGRP